MCDEVKKDEVVEDENKEAIDSIEKTVDNLKKKIEEINNEEAKTEEKPLFKIPEIKISEEHKELLNEIKDNASETLNKYRGTSVPRIF